MFQRGVNILFLTFVLLGGACKENKNEEKDEMISTQKTTFSNSKSGKDCVMKTTYSPALLDTFSNIPLINSDLALALNYHTQIVQKQKNEIFRIGNLLISGEQLVQTAALLQSFQFIPTNTLPSYFDCYQISNEEDNENVRFTGYYTPFIEANYKPTKSYRYPIYVKNKNDSEESEYNSNNNSNSNNNNNSANLVPAAYVKSIQDINAVRLQGSAYAKYPNGIIETFSYSGRAETFIKNNLDVDAKKLRQSKTTADSSMIVNSSLSEYQTKRTIKLLSDTLKNAKSFLNRSPSTYFSRSKAPPLGAANTSLTPEYSISVDKNYIPLGSCLLAAIPISNKDGILTHYEYRFVLAQDTGGAIQGSNRIDLYTGVGEEGKKKASRTHHNGRLWLLLPKQNKKS